MRIKNINGTSKNKCNCGSWLQHWKNYSGITPSCCSEINCFKEDIEGAHVQKCNSDMNWYIVPLCKQHNKSLGEIEVDDLTVLIPANIQETCGK